MNGWCRSCRKQANDLQSTFHALAGGREAYSRLSPAQRLALRESARHMQQADLKFQRAVAEIEEDPRGFVYVLWNPAWPDAVKIGKASNHESRCRNFQTGSPYRDYTIKYAMPFEDALTAEKWIHLRLIAHQLEGEWFRLGADDAQEAIEAYSRLIDNQLENIT